ncbi:hypothetical protein [Pseudomonas syringae]|uniref:hypothetical protein n=1 Tax=Pseudomonas syringae TaxID=317 RepID=UPI001F3921D3|nr:hypothetical protein [Pseudomonas syringae]
MSQTSEEMVSTDVSTLELGISDRLSRVAATLVRNKYLVDKAVSADCGAMLARDLHGGGYGPHEGSSFLAKVIPFLQVGDDSQTSFQALVPTAHTLGCSWRWRPTSVKPEKVSRLRDQLTDTQALVDGTLNTCQYTWIKPLGLIAPSEGKNRVDFLREQGEEVIPANVYERTYPSADRITLYKIKSSGFKDTWAVLDGRWVQKLWNPSWTIPLLEAYGVRTDESWPSTFPNPKLVVSALFEHPGDMSPLGHPDLGTAVIVDLDTITAREMHQSEEIDCNLVDLKYVSHDIRIWFAAALAFVIGVIMLGAVPNEWLQVKVAAGIVIGMAMGAAFVPLVLKLKTSRRNVKHQLPLPPEKAPKYEGRTGRRLLG